MIGVTLQPVDSVTQCQTDEIRTRLWHIKKSKITSCYAVLIGRDEVAFVALDKWPEYVTLYDLYVALPFRGRGVGSNLLSWIEGYVRDEGFHHIKLCARPLEAGASKSKLKKWYTMRGYTKTVGGSDELEKSLLY